jgi:hypothetical protein
MALEKAPMWAVQEVRHFWHSYTLGDVRVAMAHDTWCEKCPGNNELIGVSFSLF